MKERLTINTEVLRQLLEGKSYPSRTSDSRPKGSLVGLAEEVVDDFEKTSELIIRPSSAEDEPQGQP